MQEIIKLLIGIAVLILGIPIGDILARNTSEELGSGRKWFLLLILICFGGVILSLIFREDILLFTLLFIAIVTSRSLAGKDVKKIAKRKKSK